jgi:NADH dehydrogenase
MTSRQKVVIIGAGFAGLNASRALRHVPVDVVLIDHNNYHTFQPLLYQVATAQLDPEETARNVREAFHRQKNLRFRLGSASGIDFAARTVVLADGGSETWDWLIYGAGTVYNDFGTPGVAQHGFFLKTLTEAVNIRSHILRQFELASAHPHLIDEGCLNFVIVGGGPTGVELAGSMVELFDRVLPRDFPQLDVSRARVTIVEMTDSLLGPYTDRSRKYALKVLEDRGVDVRLTTAVKEVTAHAAILADGSLIPTRTLIWAAGIRGVHLAEQLGLPLERGLRISINPDLSVPGHERVFIAGDAAGAPAADGPQLPQVAQVAIQQGRFAARQIIRQLQGQPTEAFRYDDRGNMAIIGRNAGVAELSPKLGSLRLRGFPGWLGWLFIHLIYLPGYRNRFMALLTWAISYFTFERHARLITPMVPSPGEVENHAGNPDTPPVTLPRQPVAEGYDERHAKHLP